MAFDCFDTEQVTFNLSQIWSKGRRPLRVDTANCVLPHTSLSAEPVFQADRCVGFKVRWLKDCDTEATYKGTVVNPALGCDLPQGTGPDAECIEYDLNCFIEKNKSFKDTGCESDLSFAALFAETMASGIDSMDKAVNEALIAFMTANAGENQYEDTIGTVAGSLTNVASSTFEDVGELLCEFDYAAEENCLGDNYKILSGKNLHKYTKLAGTSECCDGKTTDNLMQRLGICHDIKLDTTLGRKSTFIFDPAVIGFSNISNYSNTAPAQIDTKLNIWAWRISSPRLKYRVLTDTGFITKDVYYDVEWQRECCGVDKLGKRLYENKIKISFIGWTGMAPLVCCPTGTTGILEYVNV